MAEPQERTPLLPSDDAFLDALDAAHDPDVVQDHPPTPQVRKVKEHLLTAAAGHANATAPSSSSPSLQLRLKQGVDHGFSNVWGSMKRALPSPSTTTTTTTAHDAAQKRERERHATVFTVLLLAVMTMFTMMSVSPALLVFMNEVGYTTPTQVAPYIVTAALSTAVPIVSNVALTSLASRVGPGYALAYGSLLSALGLALVMVTRHSLAVFMLGFALYTSNNSFRVVRISLLSKVVPPNQRTTILATHALMIPIGAMLGPLAWIAAQTFRTSVPLLGGALILDRFTINFGVTIVVLLLMSVLAFTRLRHITPYEPDEDVETATATPNGTTEPRLENHNHTPAAAPANSTGADASDRPLRPVTIRFDDGTQQTVDLNKYRNNVFMFFCFIMCCANISMGIFMVSFQPILVNVFLVSDARLGLLYELISVFAVIPPLLVAVLSRKLMDRQILATGLCIKLVGMVLFLPLFGPVTEWQVVVGFLLIIKASIFFTTGSLSLFTKLLGPMSTSSLLGILSSAAAIGPAIIQIGLSNRIVGWFGSVWFGAFALPTVLAIAAIFYPPQWRKLNPDCEYISLVTEEASQQQQQPLK